MHIKWGAGLQTSPSSAALPGITAKILPQRTFFLEKKPLCHWFRFSQKKEKLLKVECHRTEKHKYLFALRHCYCVACSSYRNGSIKEFIKTLKLIYWSVLVNERLRCSTSVVSEFSGVTSCALAGWWDHELETHLSLNTEQCKGKITWLLWNYCGIYIGGKNLALRGSC